MVHAPRQKGAARPPRSPARAAGGSGGEQSQLPRPVRDSRLLAALRRQGACGKSRSHPHLRPAPSGHRSARRGNRPSTPRSQSPHAFARTKTSRRRTPREDAQGPRRLSSQRTQLRRARRRHRTAGQGRTTPRRRRHDGAGRRDQLQPPQRLAGRRQLPPRPCRIPAAPG